MKTYGTSIFEFLFQEITFCRASLVRAVKTVLEQRRQEAAKVPQAQRDLFLEFIQSGFTVAEARKSAGIEFEDSLALVLENIDTISAQRRIRDPQDPRISFIAGPYHP